MGVTEQINYLLGQMPDSEKYLLLEIVKRSVPDDTATPDDIEAILRSREELSRGETVSHGEMDWR
jgi:hypothetical protein